MLFTNASYMPEMDMRWVGRKIMGINRDNNIVLLKKCDLFRIAFLGKKSDFGNCTRVEGKYDCETGPELHYFGDSGAYLVESP
jgi:hypothetical protein